MSPELAIAGVMLAALVIYTLSAGADFGGGAWLVFASGPRADDQRDLVDDAIGPIWEANHVWLILVVVLLFVCFPLAFAAISTARLAWSWPLTSLKSRSPSGPGASGAKGLDGSGIGAALIAAGAVPFGLGSDIGGSIRIPAAFCGITGHKPSGRALPNSGQFPAPHGEALAMLCPGPLARHATDLMTLLKILAGPDGVDPVCQSVEWTDEAILPSDVTVYEAKTNGRSMPTEEMQTAVERSRRELEKRGAKHVAAANWKPRPTWW